MDNVYYYLSGSFINYNHIFLNQVTNTLSDNYLKITSIDENVDIFKNLIFESVIYPKRLYIYNCFDEIFYEIKFKLDICNYIMIQNNLLLSLNNGKNIIKIILKLNNEIVQILDEKLSDIPYLLDMENTILLLYNSTNIKELKHLDDIDYVVKDDIFKEDNIVIKKLLKFKSEKYSGIMYVTDFKNKYLFEVSKNEIKDVSFGNVYIFNSDIIDCFNLNDTSLLIMLYRRSKKGLKYYIFTKQDGSYIKFKTINDVISYLDDYYTIIRESVYVK